MPEIANVIPNEPVASEWGNDIRDRTVQRYASVAGRTGLNPTPGAGDLSYLADTGAVEVFHGGVWRGMVPVSVVLPYAGITPPAGFLVCDGSAVSRSTYAALYAAIGTTYGAGDGSTTFNLPDLRGRFPFGVAAAGVGSTLGEVAGSLTHSHAGPSHTHTGPGHAHTMGTHTHTGPSHSHSEGSLLIGNTDGVHSHAFSDTSSGPSSTGTVALGTSSVIPLSSHTHSVSGSTSSTGAHGHGIDGTTGSAAGTTGATDPGDTAVGGTNATGASGTAATGPESSVPPLIALNWIIRT